ncbi:hypothetical protein B0A49_10068 [Cryomyces minteri]|uniref:Uncharacterized protein n=1 Tax=Cryomyces minteri TaxID=331657 RepID=A0A4U0WI33_9PEZI|nr:hypothetical protein B0A49_10068 [Cryomyces minteri]
MSDFRNLQHYICAVQMAPSAEEHYLEGYKVLRACSAEAKAVLLQPFAATSQNPRGDVEKERAQLRHVILDASIRRFQAHMIYLQVTAAVRWINSRSSVTRGQTATAAHLPALQHVDNTLRAELASITDERVALSLRSQDSAQGKWILEDPSLATIQQWLRARR